MGNHIWIVEVLTGKIELASLEKVMSNVKMSKRESSRKLSIEKFDSKTLRLWVMASQSTGFLRKTLQHHIREVCIILVSSVMQGVL